MTKKVNSNLSRRVIFKDEMVIAKVFRYDPSIDVTPAYVNYEIPWREDLTVLEVLRWIHENVDPISWRYSCRGMMCLKCGLQVNEEPRLACITLVKPGEEILIEPLQGFPVIKDLVVDYTKVRERESRARHWLQRAMPAEEPEVIDYQRHLTCLELMKCKACYLCHSVCPVVDVAWDKFCGPTVRMRIALRAYDPRDEADRLKQLVAEGLWLCSLCLKCKEVCPRDIDIPTLTVKDLREKAVAEGLPIPHGYIELVNMASKTGRVMEARGKSLLETMPETIKVENPVTRVAFFTGCVFDHMLQDAGRAALNVLKRNRVEVVLPKKQVCCGMPLFWTGQSRAAEDLVKKNVEVFEKAGVDIVLTMCAACGSTWREDIQKAAERVLGRKPKFDVLDIHDFLAKKIELAAEEMEQVEAKVTYHDPCHLKRGMGVYEEPRALIRKIPGIEFVEMRKADRCCGGFLRYNQPESAYRIGRIKVGLAMDSGADVIATACPLCTNQLRMITGRMSLDMKVLNVVELLERAYEIR